MKSKLLTTIGLLLLTPKLLLADAGWTDAASVIELTPGSHGRYLVKLDLSNNHSGCKDKQIFYQDYTDSVAPLIYNTLLQAITHNKKVRMYVTGKCELSGYSEINAASILP